jgi:hypothetical protein
MKNVVVRVLIVAALVCGFGIYRGWFTVDRQKIEQDENAAKTTVQDLEQKVKEGASSLSGPVKDKK